MPIIMTNDVIPDICPVCAASKSVDSYTIHDPEFATFNQLTPLAADRILPKGAISFLACDVCGFSWINNNLAATSAQIRWNMISLGYTVFKKVAAESTITAFMRLARQHITIPTDGTELLLKSRGAVMHKFMCDYHEWLDVGKLVDIIPLYNICCHPADKITMGVNEFGSLPPGVPLEEANVALVD